MFLIKKFIEIKICSNVSIEKMPVITFFLNILTQNFPTYDWFCADGSHTSNEQATVEYNTMIQFKFIKYRQSRPTKSNNAESISSNSCRTSCRLSQGLWPRYFLSFTHHVSQPECSSIEVQNE